MPLAEKKRNLFGRKRKDWYLNTHENIIFKTDPNIWDGKGWTAFT
jgi:hypothetical protein